MNVVEAARSAGIVLGRTDRGIGLWPAPGAHPTRDTIAKIESLVREHKTEVTRTLAETDPLLDDPAGYIPEKTGNETYFPELWRPYQGQVDAATDADDLLGLYDALDGWREAIECYVLPRHAQPCSPSCLVNYVPGLRKTTGGAVNG